MKNLLMLLVLVAISAPVLAADRVVTLSVPGMTCPACPITVKTALFRVDGVEKIDVAFEQREVVVTFNDSKTSTQRLTQATRNAGYPSTIKP